MNYNVEERTDDGLTWRVCTDIEPYMAFFEAGRCVQDSIRHPEIVSVDVYECLEGYVSGEMVHSFVIIREGAPTNAG